MSDDLQKASWRAITACSFIELILAVYGGYFGAGIGFVMLGMFAALGMRDIHAMGAIRSLCGSDQCRGGGDFYRGWGCFVAAVCRDGGGRAGGRVVRSALRAESRSTEGARVGDRGWAGDERVLFCYGALGAQNWRLIHGH